MKKPIALLALLALFCAGTALAKTPAAGTNATKNESATKAEKKQRPKFEECDKDKDGALNMDEFVACFPKSGGKFEAIDANHDGKATKAELKAYRAANKKSKMSNDEAPKKSPKTNATKM